jgi:hypothetical protein
MEGNYPEWRSSSPIDCSGFLDYQPTARLSELINGKTIAYVCPAPNLVGLNMGEFIDSHDIIIRAGNLSYLPEHLHCDYGKRTDVLIHSFNHIEIGEAKRNIEFFKSLKYVMCAMVSTTFLKEHNEWIEYLDKRICPAEKIDDRCLFKAFREIGTIANVGLSGLVHILKYNIRSVYVTGMTFYNMGTFGKVYNSDYYDMVTRRQKLYDPNEDGLTTGEQARFDIHHQPSQIKYFKEKILTDKRVIPDQFLFENFLNK